MKRERSVVSSLPSIFSTQRSGISSLPIREIPSCNQASGSSSSPPIRWISRISRRDEHDISTRITGFCRIHRMFFLFLLPNQKSRSSLSYPVILSKHYPVIPSFSSPKPKIPFIPVLSCHPVQTLSCHPIFSLSPKPKIPFIPVLSCHPVKTLSCQSCPSIIPFIPSNLLFVSIIDTIYQFSTCRRYIVSI